MADAYLSDAANDGGPTCVYRYYDKNGLLLYVGITGRGMARNSEHNNTKEWWEYVTRQEVDHYKTRRAAHNVERQLIEQYRPPFNVQHNPWHIESRAAYLDMHASGKPMDAKSMGRRLPGVASQNRILLSPMTLHRERLTLISEPLRGSMLRTLTFDSNRPFSVSSGGRKAKVTQACIHSSRVRIDLRVMDALACSGGELMIRNAAKNEPKTPKLLTLYLPPRIGTKPARRKSRDEEPDAELLDGRGV